MRQKKVLFLLGMSIITSLALSACGSQPDPVPRVEPVEVRPIGDTGLNQITLTERAAERLDIQMESVRQAELNGVESLVVSNAAIIYDLNGNTWVYVNSAPRTFHREPVKVNRIEGDTVYLDEGLLPDSMVVVVGVAELYGIDTGVGK